MAQACDALGCPVFYEFSTMDSRFYPQYAAQVDRLGTAYLQLGDAVNWANAFIALYRAELKAAYMVDLFMHQDIRYDIK